MCRRRGPFARLGLVDQYVFLVEPVALGAGQRLFAERAALTPIETKSYACGVTRHTYRPATSTATPPAQP